MANQRISQFTYTSTITGDELIGVAINGQNKSISVGQILAAADESCKNVEHDKRSGVFYFYTINAYKYNK